MEALAWLAIPVGAVVLALLWVAWASRPPRRRDVDQTVRDYERSKAALDRAMRGGPGADRRSS